MSVAWRSPPMARPSPPGAQDKTVRLWDIATGQPIGPILRHTESVGSVAFLDDGKSLFAGAWKECRLFAVPPDLPAEVERMAAWVEVITGLRLDKQQGLIQVLDNAAWLERHQQLMQQGGPPRQGPTSDSTRSSSVPIQRPAHGLDGVEALGRGRSRFRRSHACAAV